jgi:hypothetical protein
MENLAKESLEGLSHLDDLDAPNQIEEFVTKTSAVLSRQPNSPSGQDIIGIVAYSLSPLQI